MGTKRGPVMTSRHQAIAHATRLMKKNHCTMYVVYEMGHFEAVTGSDRSGFWQGAITTDEIENDMDEWVLSPMTHEEIAAEIEALKKENIWQSHPDHPKEDWQAEVANNDTHIGYWDYVFNCMTEENS